MAAQDIVLKDSNNGFGATGAKRFTVASGATAILSGEPVAKALGNSSGKTVTQGVTNSPVVATDFWAGIAVSASTQTASAAGTVDVQTLSANTVYLIAPNVAATWNTQAKYDALVGARVLLDLTAGVFTILATDGATNGCVVEPLDISLYPGKVAFSIRGGVNYLA